MNEADAEAVRAEIERQAPYLVCEIRPRIHTGNDMRAPDPADEWSVVVTNAATGVVVNVTDSAAWRDQLQPALTAPS